MKQKQSFTTALKNRLAIWLGAPMHLGMEQRFGAQGNFASDAGVAVGAERAMQLSAVWACVRLLAQTISTLPLGLYVRTADGRSSADDTQLARILSLRPNADMTAVVFWETLIGQACLLGNGFAEKLTIDGRLVGLELLSAQRLSWSRQPNGQILFTYYLDNGSRRFLNEDQVFHLPGFALWGKFGMSVIQYGAQVFGSAMAANKAASSTFKNGLLPTTYFKYPKVLKENQRTEAREAIQQISGAVNSGKSVILEADMDVGELGINPNDAQLLESRGYSVEDICRWFGIPPSMIGATDKASSWASSSEQLNLWFLQYGLRPWLKRIEQAIWKDLMTPAEQVRMYAEFSVEGLLRADTSARVALYSMALQNGWMNRNEVRKLENLPSIEGGDKFTVQTNLTPLENLGEVPEADNVRETLKAFLGLVNGGEK